MLVGAGVRCGFSRQRTLLALHIRCQGVTKGFSRLGTLYVSAATREGMAVHVSATDHRRMRASRRG